MSDPEHMIERVGDEDWQEITLSNVGDDLELEFRISRYRSGFTSVDVFGGDGIPKDVLIDFLKQALDMLEEP